LRLTSTEDFSWLRNGMNASLVIGEAKFTTAGTTTTAAGQSFPDGLITVPPLY